MENSLYFKHEKFRIMLVGDPHTKLPDESKEKLDKMQDYLDYQYEAVKQLKPDLVILMGDNASADTHDDLKSLLMMITQPYVKAGVPFSFILGNHDLECGVNDLKTQYRIYSELPGCILPIKEVSDYGDYILTVFGSDKTTPKCNIWHFYSGNRYPDKQISYYDVVKKEQLDWYSEKELAFQKAYGNIIPAIAVQHIPVPEIMECTTERTPLSVALNGVQGQNGYRGKYYSLKKGVTGYMGEGPCPPDINNGQFSAWLKAGDIFAAFFGHDHMNDFVGKVQGILLGQCKTSSFFVYGDGFEQGVRIVDLDEKNIKNIRTEMIRFKELLPGKCRSIHGLASALNDKNSIRLEHSLKLFGATALTSVLIALIIKLCKKQ